MLCKGLKPGDGKRLQAHAQRCGALAEPGEELCAVHLKASGRRRCATCRAWLVDRWTERDAGAHFVTLCPKGCEVGG
jgi:hypothetical protein